MSFYLIILLLFSSTFSSETIGLVMKQKGRVDYIPYDKNKATNGNGTMVGLLANSKTKVDQFHQNALNHGAVNEGLPGARHGKDYYCYIRDLDGNKITVFSID